MIRRTPLSAHLASMLAGALLVAGGALAGVRAADVAGNPYFIIRVVDAQTDRGVPMVELETVNHLTHISDSAGIIAFNEPGLMEREVYFHVRSHGYDYPKDGFGYRGLKLTPRAGTQVTVKVMRQNIAERLYRVTGAGIYRDSVLAGLPVPLRQPVLNADVMGQDTVIATPYRGKLYWFWGDTDQVRYPLGNFAASGATSELPGQGGLDPNIGVDLTYFTGANGFSKAVCPGFGPGLHWIESVMTVPDETGTARLVARVSSQHGLVAPYAWHLAVFNDEQEIFESKSRWENPESHDSAHPFRARSGNTEFLYLYPNFRVKPDLRSLSDRQRYEAFTCVAGDGMLREGSTTIDRDSAGRPLYTWKAGADRLYGDRIQTLNAAQLLQPGESSLYLRDFATGTPFVAGRGSVFWNDFRRCWVRLVAGAPGEVWFAAADTPTGPWGYARRIVSHHDYNFYNLTQHPSFDQSGGRMIFFEGTYTASFSAAKTKTPRYDYNQVMYRLALDDARLDLTVALYQVVTAGGGELMRWEQVAAAAAWDRMESVPFFAVSPERAPAGLIPIYQDATHRLSSGPPTPGGPLFFALPVSTSRQPGIAGRWLARFIDQAGAKTELELEFSERAGTIRTVSPDGKVQGAGIFQADQLTHAVTLDDRSYALSAAVRDGTLRGDWHRDDRQESGTWTAQWQDVTPAEYRSPAVVPLYEYRGGADTRPVYSTEPHLSRKGFVRTAEPICLVWRNPSSAITFDRAPLSAFR